jgi:hypothetical protein
LAWLVVIQTQIIQKHFGKRVKRRYFRQLPLERLSLSDYFSEELTTPDAICRQAAVIEGYEFDRVKYFLVPKQSL